MIRHICTVVPLGFALGLGLLLLRLANAASYLSDASTTCLNCHVMTNAYATWERGSHGKVAQCNDCHVPQSNLVARYGFKALDGLKHAWVFTLRREPQVLRLSHPAVHVVQSNCTRCHKSQFLMIRLADPDERPCWDCHRNIHGPVRSLSSSPHVLRPQLPAAGLSWMRPEDSP